MDDAREFVVHDLQYEDHTFRIRFAKELAQDDLGVEKLSRVQFDGWIAANLVRVCGAALAKRLARPAQASGEDWIVTLHAGDLDNF